MISQGTPAPCGSKPKAWLSSTWILADERLVGVDDEGNCTVWDPSLNQIVSTFVLPATMILGQAAENEIVAQWPINGSLMVVNVASGKVQRQLKQPLRVDCWRIIGKDKNRRFVGIGRSTLQGRVGVWNLNTGQRILKIDIDETNVSGDIAADAALVATVSHHANLHVWNIEKGRRTASWREAPSDRTVESTVEEEPEDRDGYELTAVAISPDGKKIMVGEISGRVFIFRHERGKLKRLR